MKDQYFGDVSDYRKYGILRAMLRQQIGTLLVAWMLTPDDESRDGLRRAYLNDPKWRRLDPELFDGITKILKSSQRPQLSLMEEAGLLPRTDYYSAIVPDDAQSRVSWHQNLLRYASNADVVFLDPDNGIEVSSKPIGRKGSSKYVSWEDIRDLWGQGNSLLIFQHYCRRPRPVFRERLISDLNAQIAPAFVDALETPHVMFLAVAQRRHEHAFREAVQSMTPWSHQRP